jgi:hypothetical protein
MSSAQLSMLIDGVDWRAPGGRWIGSAPRPIVARIDPQSAHLGSAAARIEHGNRGVVGEDFARSKHMRGQARLQRLQPPASTPNPVRQGRAVDLDAVSGEDL